MDVEDDAEQAATITFKPTINKTVVANGKTRYTDARSTVKEGEVKGSISFASRVTIQPSKASLENDLSKNVEFVTAETTRKVVFDGTYTAKKGDVKLNTVSISGNTATPLSGDITFYVFIDGEEIATLDDGEEDTFTDILVKAGESVKVKVEAEVYTDVEDSTVRDYQLTLSGEDDNGNSNSGTAKDNTVGIKTVKSGTVNIVSSSTKNTVLLRARNTELATFTIKPSNNNEGLTLESIYLTGTAG
jgi:hypothetical protein